MLWRSHHWWARVQFFPPRIPNKRTYCQTGGCSGAEIVALCQEAALLTMQQDMNAPQVRLSWLVSAAVCGSRNFECHKQVPHKAFIAAAKAMKRQITPAVLQKFERWREASGVRSVWINWLHAHILSHYSGRLPSIPVSSRILIPRNELPTVPTTPTILQLGTDYTFEVVLFFHVLLISSNAAYSSHIAIPLCGHKLARYIYSAGSESLLPRNYSFYFHGSQTSTQGMWIT